MAAVALCTVAAVTPLAHAADAWPARPITLIVPFSAGGNVDFQARLIGQKLGERLGQSVIIDNVARSYSDCSVINAPYLIAAAAGPYCLQRENIDTAQRCGVAGEGRLRAGGTGGMRPSWRGPWGLCVGGNPARALP